MDVNINRVNAQAASVSANQAVAGGVEGNRTAQSVSERLRAERAASEPRVSLRDEDITDDMLRTAFNDANRALLGGSFRLSYSPHDSGRILVRVHDTETNEVVREIPPETRLDIYARITEFVGLLFDQGN